MRYSKFMIILFLFFTPAGVNMFAQTSEMITLTTAVPFLLIAPDSRFSALGESGSALADNSSAIFWNPAGIAFLTGQEFAFTHSNWLPQFKLDLFYDYATYRNYIPEIGGSVTASITYMNYGEFVRTGPESPTPIGTFRSFDMAATVGYATKLSTDFGLGLNFRVIHSRLSDQPTAQEQGSGTATSVSFDAGFIWRPSKLVIPLVEEDLGNNFSLGVSLSNLGPKISYIDRAQADPIPSNFRFGLAYRLMSDEFNSLTLTADFSKLLVRQYEEVTINGADTSRVSKSDEFYKAIFSSWVSKPFNEVMADINSSVGLEYWYGTPGDFLFSLRGGVFYEDPSHGNRKFITMGAGIRYDLYGFDFSYLSTSVFPDGANHPLSDTLRFTILVGWGAVPDATKGLPRGI